MANQAIETGIPSVITDCTKFKIEKDIKLVTFYDNTGMEHYFDILGIGTFSAVIDLQNGFVLKIPRRTCMGFTPEQLVDYSFSRYILDYARMSTLDKIPLLDVRLIKFKKLKSASILMHKHTGTLVDYIKQEDYCFRIMSFKNIVKQLATVLYVMDKGGILHRDIKPQNILVDWTYGKISNLYVIDWGLACYHHDIFAKQKLMRGSTYWYRAPEVFALRLKNNMGYYDIQADVWSLGCVILEIIIGKPPFATNNENETLQKIREFTCSILGSINVRNVLQYYLTPQEREYISPHLIDLLEKMLTIDPTMRITPSHIMEHSYCRDLYLLSKLKIIPSHSDTYLYNLTLPPHDSLHLLSDQYELFFALCSKNNILRKRYVTAVAFYIYASLVQLDKDDGVLTMTSAIFITQKIMNYDSPINIKLQEHLKMLLKYANQHSTTNIGFGELYDEEIRILTALDGILVGHDLQQIMALLNAIMSAPIIKSATATASATTEATASATTEATASVAATDTISFASVDARNLPLNTSEGTINMIIQEQDDSQLEVQSKKTRWSKLRFWTR